MLRTGDTPLRRWITIWIDNEEVLDRARHSSTKDLTLNLYHKRDFALNQHMTHLITQLTTYCNLQFCKVKGHQKGELLDLPFEAQLNTLADKGAEFMGKRVYGPQQQKTPLSKEGIWITDKHGI